MLIADVDLSVLCAETLDRLAGVISIDVARVADGVMLIQASPRQDLRAVCRDLLNRLASRGQAKAS